ncbi:MAG: hypothetical protein KJ792_16175 [Actinobacteria bacterium]|nr:hypothetical protein [Actinomycetota bacterium]
MTDAGHPGDGADLPAFGDGDVDLVLARLTELADQPLRAHVSAFDAVHTGLQNRLAEADGAGR